MKSCVLGILMLVLITSVSGYDLEIAFRENNFIVNNSVDNFFEIKNLDYYENKTITDIEFSYNISFNSQLIKSDEKVFKDFKYKKYSGTGELFVEESGKYTVCGSVKSHELEDNYSNNKICKDFFTLSTNIKCDFSPKIYLENNQKIVDGDKIKFKIFGNNFENENLSLPYVIEYWIEDINSNIVKKKVNTTNTYYKTFTVKSNQPKTFIIKSKIYTASCIDQDLTNNENFEIVITKNLSTNLDTFQILDLDLVGNVLFVRFRIVKNNSNPEFNFWLESEGKVISNKFEYKFYSNYEPFEFLVPIYFASDSNTAKLVIDSFGTRIEQVISISSNNSEISLNPRNLFKTESIINSQKVGLSIGKRVIPAALGLLLSIANIIRL